jgi:predicted porin
MKKKLLTLAVAAAVAAPALASAEAIMYGKLNVSVDYADVTNAIMYPEATRFEGAGTLNNPWVLDENNRRIPVQGAPTGEDFKGWGMSNNGIIGASQLPGSDPRIQPQGRASRLGVKGSEDLGNGLKAIYQIEFGINPNDTNGNVINNNDTISMRNTFVGLAGNWGTFLIGRHDTPLKISTGKLDLFADTMADYNGTVGFQDLRADNAVAYVSPSFSGFQLMAAVVPAGGATGGAGLNINADGINEGYSLAGIYSNGPFYASVAYESLGSELGMGTGASLAGSSACYVDVAGTLTPTDNCGYVGDDFNKWRIGLGILDWNGFTLAAIYEDQSDILGGQGWSSQYFTTDPNDPAATYRVTSGGLKDQTLWQVQAAYAFGNSQIKAMYGSVDRGDQDFLGATLDDLGNLSLDSLRTDLEGDRTTWAVGYDYSFSKRTKAYALYTSVDDDNADVIGGSEWSGFSLGMMHSF